MGHWEDQTLNRTRNALQMENGATDYLSFIRGFVAAINRDTPDHHGGANPDGGPHHSAFSAGFTAGSHRWAPAVDYRKLSIQDHGRFAGTLDLPDNELDAGDEPALSGVLDLSDG